MAQVLKLKRTAVQGKVPTTSSLELGELAINTYDGKIYFEKDNGTPSVQTLLVTDSTTTGSINLIGAVTASYFRGDGSALTNLPNADVSQVATVTASFDNQSNISVTHNFDTRNILVSVYDTTYAQIIPSSVILTNNNSVDIELSSAQSGFAVVAKGGHIVSGTLVQEVTEVTTVTASFDNQSTISVTHSFGSKNILVSVYDTNDSQIIPSSVVLTNSNTATIGLSSAQSGYVVVAKGGHLVNATGTISYNNLTDIPSGIISGSSGAPAGTISGSSQLTSSFDQRYTLSGSIPNIPTGSFATTGSNTFNGNQTISGSLFVNGTTELGGNLVPKTAKGATLGTLERPFSEIFLSSGSLNIASDTLGAPNTQLSNVNGNILISAGGMQLVGTGSFNASTASFSYLSGSFTHIGAQFNNGDIVTTGSLKVSGSTIMIGNNTMTGNTLLSGSFGITGSTSFSELGNTSLSTFSSSLDSRLDSIEFLTASLGVNATTGSYGSFYDTTTQSGSANTAYVMKLNSSIHQNGINLSGSGAMVISQTGVYDIEFSAQLSNTTNSTDTLDIWLRKNGTNVESSNTTLTIDKSKDLVAAWNWVDTATAGDYYEIMWSNTTGNVVIKAQPISSSPTRPAIPSVIATIHRVDVGGITYVDSQTGQLIVSSSTGTALTVYGNSLFRGTQTLSGSIIPAIDNTYDLGSPTYQWRDIYVSSGSLYIDGTKVLGSTGNELQITTDVGQSIKILEAGSDSIILQSADGDIQLKSSGGGNLLFDPTSGLIDVRGTLQIQDGNKITSSGGNSIQFGNDLGITGSINTSGTINGVNISNLQTTFNTFTGSSNTALNGLNSYTSSLNTAISTSGSNVTILGNLSVAGTQTIVNSTTIQIGDNIIELNGTGATNAGLLVKDATAPNTNSGSLLWDSTNDYWKAGVKDSESKILLAGGDSVVSGSSQIVSILLSLNTFSSSVETKNNTLGTYTSSLETKNSTLATYTGSIDAKNNTLGTYTSSLETKNSTLATYTGSLETKNSTLATYTGSVNSQLTSLINATSSYETKGRGIVSGSSQVDVMSTTNISKLATTGSNTFAGNQTINGNISLGSTNTSYVGPSQYGGIMFPRGQVLFSNTNTQNQLYLSSNAYTNASGVFAYRNTGQPATFIGQDNGVVSIGVAGNGTADATITFTTAMSISNAGNTTFGGTITENSSIRYKENVETIKYGLDKVLQMRGVTYDKKDNGVKEMGVIAEEIYEVLPELVLKNEEGEIDSVSYGRITAVLIEAIKDLKKEIEDLKSNR